MEPGTESVERKQGWSHRLTGAVRQALRQGSSPEALASAVALGVAVGVIPFVGVATPLGIAGAFVLGLNQPVVQAANYLAYPLQIGLLLPFIHLGERLFGQGDPPLALAALLQGFRTDAWHAVVVFWTLIWHACVAWALVAPLGGVLLSRMLRPAFRLASNRLAAARGMPAD